MNPLLNVQNLAVSFATYKGEIKAVNHISFQIYPGEAVGIVGESGCGKSVTAHAIMQLVAVPPGKITSGKILFQGNDLLQKPEAEMKNIRGNDISIIFQDPMTSLNPVLTVGLQIAEALMAHQHINKTAAYAQAVELLKLVKIPSPEKRLHNYPHQFSGGMRQRVMIAIALACKPKLLIADEPTTALDVTIQAQILALMRELQSTLNMSVMLISHDLGAIASLCNRVMVMYAGRIVESGTATDIFHAPQHPYTWGLLQCIPRVDGNKKNKLAVIEGQPPDLLNPPAGCPFSPRCRHAMRVCVELFPETTFITPSHYIACWLQHPLAPQNGGVRP